jgi:hypothetical protein
MHVRKATKLLSHTSLDHVRSAGRLLDLAVFGYVSWKLRRASLQDRVAAMTLVYLCLQIADWNGCSFWGG